MYIYTYNKLMIYSIQYIIIERAHKDNSSGKKRGPSKPWDEVQGLPSLRLAIRDRLYEEFTWLARDEAGSKYLN